VGEGWLDLFKWVPLRGVVLPGKLASFIFVSYFVTYPWLGSPAYCCPKGATHVPANIYKSKSPQALSATGDRICHLLSSSVLELTR
jgi:hypothetical protein